MRLHAYRAPSYVLGVRALFWRFSLPTRSSVPGTKRQGQILQAVCSTYTVWRSLDSICMAVIMDQLRRIHEAFMAVSTRDCHRPGVFDKEIMTVTTHFTTVLSVAYTTSDGGWLFPMHVP